MSYQVIARKYRPQRFSDVVGQEHVTQTLANAIEQNRIAHAYLFVGPRGTGKTTIARIFAKCLNCTGGPKPDFPDDDPRCQEIAEGRSLDVLEIDGASNRGIEEIRELRETVKYSPSSSKFKIYIIDEVHMLTKEAFNALLKTLEEPPAHVKFMFATTEPEKVLPTILSRCQRFDLRRIPVAKMVKHLAHIARLEKIDIDEPALEAIARGADGGLRDAESTLDQLISFCGNKIVESDVLSVFGLAGRSQILQLSQTILNGDSAGALRLLNDLVKNGKDLGRLLGDLLNHFRNALLLNISKGDASLLEASESELKHLQEVSASLSSENITRVMEVLADAEWRLKEAASKKILFELTLLKAIEARSAVSIDSVLRQLNQLRSSGGTPTTPGQPAPALTGRPAEPTLRTSFSSTAAPAPISQPASPTAAPSKTAMAAPPAVAVPPPVVAAPENSSFSLIDLWTRLVDAIGRASPFAKSYYLEAHPVSFQNNVLTIGFDPEFADHISLVDNSRNHTMIQTKLQELGYSRCHVKFVKAEAPEGWSRNPPMVESITAPVVAPNTETSPDQKSATASFPPPEKVKKEAAPVVIDPSEFKNDPLIKKALEVFKGQIVEVRA